MISLLFGVAYWYVWTVWKPRRNGCTLEERVEVLKDGTTVTKLVEVPGRSKVTTMSDVVVRDL